MNAVSFFEIQVDDLQKAIDFYSSIFGWEFTKQEGLPIEYYQIKTDGINGGMLKRPAEKPGPMHGTNAYCCSMEVTNFDETAQAILAKGGQVAMEKFAVPGKCWQGYFLDLDGNVFGMFQVDENAK